MRGPQKRKSCRSVVGISAERFVFILIVEITDVMGKQHLIKQTNEIGAHSSYFVCLRIGRNSH